MTEFRRGMIYIREEEGKARLAWQCGKFGMCVRVGGGVWS